MRALLLVLSASLLTVVGASGCGGSGDGSAPRGSRSVSPASGALVNDATFRYPLPSDPGALDYAINPSSAALELLMYAYDGLVAMSDGKKVVPNLATEWQVTPTKLTFTIRDGVTCSDGSPVTPSVIARSFRFFAGPKAQTPLFGDVTDWKVSSDEETVTFTFGEPVGFALQSLANIPVVCGKGLENRELLRRKTSGSGAYVLTKSVSNDRYVLERRDGYTWGPDGATTAESGVPKTVELRVVKDASTTANLLLTGDLDAAAVTPSTTERLQGRMRIFTVPSGISQALFNHVDGHPTADADVRRALVMAMDREAIAAIVRSKVTNNLVPPFTNPCTDESNGAAIPAHDPAGAGRLLDQAGWTKGSDGKRAKAGRPLELGVVNGSGDSSESVAATELVVRSWRALGIDVKLRVLADTAFQEALFTGDWDAAPILSISVLVPSQLTGFLGGPVPPDGSNFAHIDNPVYRQESRKGLSASTTEEACQHWNAAERALYEQADVIPVTKDDQPFVLAKHVDYSVNDNGIVPTSIRMHEG
jgi:peptide/nickel transport system substrate-binding protein